MHLDEAESEILKKWVIKKLEDISDADSDVLADYVLALIKTDEPDEAAKANCIENLRDFLLDNTQSFVEDVFAAVATEAYDPSRPQLKPTASASQPSKATYTNALKQRTESRKRSYHDRERDDDQHGSKPGHGFGDRPMKQARRGGRGGFEQRSGQFQHANPYLNQASSLGHQGAMQMPQIPGMPPGMDPSHAFAAFLAMQQAMGLMPGMPDLTGAAAKQDQNGSRSRNRCRDYDSMGFCARGASCPYEHGDDPFIVPQNNEYDPTQATLVQDNSRHGDFVKHPRGDRGRGGHNKGRGRGGSNARGGRRSEFSHAGPNHDKAIRQVVVEQIPAEHLNESEVRNFFGEFGTIEEVAMQPERRLAIVKFAEFESAKAAYDSPKVVFENRFVKVYWHKPGGPSKHSNGHVSGQRQQRRSEDVDMESHEPEMDPEEIARKQEEAQRKHEEQRRLRDEAEKQKQDLDSKLKAMDAQRRQMMQKLAAKTGADPSTSGGAADSNGKMQGGEQTRELREQLAKLEAEAKSLGIDPSQSSHEWNGPSARGRGGFRGRARGRGFNSSYRGGWAAGAARAGGAVKRLDNRPKTVEITFHNGDYADHQEALQQFLLFNNAAGDSASLAPHPARKDTALIGFPERYQGEMFLAAAGAPDFPFGGSVDLSWHKPSQAPLAQENDAKPETAMDTSEVPAVQDDAHTGRDVDTYDVADDDDRWG